MNVNVFSEVPNILKTIEVDTEKKIFNVNGVPFGSSCTRFYISCEAAEGFKIQMETDTSVRFASYEMNGKKKTDHAYERHSQ